MSPGTDVVQRTPEQHLIAQVRSDVVKEQLAMVLPPTITPERFARIATTAIMTNPDIAKLDHNSVLRAMVQIGSMGLLPDGKQAAITPRKGKAVAVPMIQGFRDIAAEHGWTLRTAVVYANDEFDHAVIDGEETIIHRPVRPGGARGELVAAYAIAKHRDGRKLMTVLHPEDIAHRRRSSAYDAVWNEHPAAMWEKSAGRDLFGQLGLAENDRVQRLLSADIEPDEASAALYGPRDDAADRAATAGLPAGSDDSQQAGDGSATPGSAPAPGEDDEPSLEAAPASEVSHDDVNAMIQAAANEAAMFVPPTGKHKDKTLAEIAQSSDSDGWFRWVMRKDDMQPAFSQAVWAYCRVYKPEIFQQVLAEREAAA